MRPLTPTLAGVALTLTLAACSGEAGGDGATDVATDPAPTAHHPAFEARDYTYDLTVQCFCAGSGVPVEVTVEGGAVTGAVYAEDDNGRSGVRAGDPADQRFWLTIEDVIDLADHSDAETVDVDWPAGQDYPDRVFVDGSKKIADDEIAYSISRVRT